MRHTSAKGLRPVTEKNIPYLRSYLRSLSATLQGFSCRLGSEELTTGAKGVLQFQRFLPTWPLILTCVYGDEKRLVVLPAVGSALAINERGENRLSQRISEDSQQAF